MNREDPWGWTPLEAATDRGHKEIAEILRDAGAREKSAPDQEANPSALVHAASRGEGEIVLALIAAGADVDERNRLGETALMVASGRVDGEDWARALIEGGAQVDARDRDGATALLFAATAGHTALVEILVQAGADVDAATDRGETALMWASRDGLAGVVRLLLQAGADVHLRAEDGGTASSLAVTAGHDAIVKLLAQTRD